MNGTTITMTGNCADAPEIRFTGDGKAVARLRIAVSERQRDQNGQWIDGPPSWHTVMAWGALAEHVAESLVRGDRVVVHGSLAHREYMSGSGERRTVWEVTAEEIGLSLRHCSAASNRAVPAPGS